jgi:hypothetical protein
MKPYLLLLGGLICATGPSLLASSIDATATFTDSLISPGEYQYDLTLNNTGTTTIGTFWFSWIPGAGFMSVSPTSVESPTGWSDVLTNSSAAIQWTTTSDLLAAGDSLSGFEFDSTMTPAQLQSLFAGPGTGTGDPISTAFVYIAAPLADPGHQLVATPATAATPEPATNISVAVGFGLIILTTRKLRKPKTTLES